MLRRSSVLRRGLAQTSLRTTSSDQNRYSSSSSSISDVLDTVIVGGGVVGVSLAYHLARKGRDVLLLEKTDLTAGSTWHAAGLTTLYHPTPNVKQIHWDSINLYAQITAETGQEVGFHRPGSLRLATSPARLDEMRYALSRQGHKAAPMRLISPDEVAELVPILNMNNIHGGLLTPGEGHIDPYSLTQALAVGARKWGAQILLNSEVTGLTPRADGGWDVSTPAGTLAARRVVNCSGFWGREVGRLAGQELPLVPVQHQYLVTKSVPEVQALKKEFPVLRHLDGSFYLRQERDGLLVGPYESVESMVQMTDWAQDRVQPGFGKELFPGDLERMGPHLEICMEAFPCFARAEIQTVVNGPITYTPDLMPMVGPCPNLANMWLAVGFGYGIIHAGGIGKYLANWIANGEAPFELSEMDPARYGPWMTMDYALAKTRESYGMNNALGYPYEERRAGRPTRRVTPLHDQLVAAGAHMGFAPGGWETPLWYAAAGQQPAYRPSFFRTNWQYEQAGREYRTVTERVGLADLSSFGKLRMTGRGARQLLDRAVAGTVPRVGRTSLVHMLTPRGRVYAELTLTCVEEDSFLVVTGGGSELHDLRYLNQIARDMGADVEISNITEEYGVLSIAGPLAGQLLARVTDSQVDSWKFLEARTALIGGVQVTAVRISYTGELGWEMFVRMGDIGQLYGSLVDSGADLQLEHFGTRVINTLRIEKGFRAWGREMNVDTTPIETGLMPFVRLNKKAEFIGRAGLLAELESVPVRQLVHLALEPTLIHLEPEGDETVLSEGKPVGYTTSGCWSPLLKAPLAMASLPCFLAVPGTEVKVMLAGVPRTAHVLPGPPALTQPVREQRAKTI